jgi:two-component system, response regulator, stage 0 sporulation protein F
MSKILVADDETAIRNLCYDLLTHQGHAVITAATGNQALQAVAAEKPDLVLLDLQIPGETGISLLKKIREKAPKMPVVIFSGFIDAQVEKDAFDAGAIEVLLKGCPTSELLMKISKILESKHKIFHDKPTQKREEKILIVDDEDGVRGLLVEYFRRKGFNVLEAPSGEKAIEIVKNEKPAVMLLDITMPGMDGLVTLKKIREFDKEIGVVMATALQDETIAQEAARLGSYSYVLKPFDLQYLDLVVTTRLLLAS